MGLTAVLTGKRILLIVSGGIAAYKSLELIRRLKEKGAAVRCVLTRAGAQFVTPLSLSALSGDKVYGELFDLTDEAETLPQHARVGVGAAVAKHGELERDEREQAEIVGDELRRLIAAQAHAERRSAADQLASRHLPAVQVDENGAGRRDVPFGSDERERIVD